LTSRLREDATEPETAVRAEELFTLREDDVPNRPEPDKAVAEVEREGKLRTREGEISPPDDVRRLRPDVELDLRPCEDSRVPVEEKLRLTDLSPSRERACRAREAMPASAFRAGRRLGWALRRERFPSCPTRLRSSAAPESLRFWNWSRWTTVRARDPFG
jgi:hypothetical protein